MFMYMHTAQGICKPIINTAVVNAVKESTHTLCYMFNSYLKFLL